ncbi:hypothetical protein ACFOUP_06950 [Belliella kenyensis]|uniref:Uncharacterized protein n=1 Tax=Belliella kenyensis TaxID=1472724 RepID=A0ABV8EIJ0_9BACT|nr:hypothetical protein [Belliella kenyensis]MCH7403897.1 hypothetical protein [Belliella kenyensis]MDN3604909.1 hypothetical protein [Belliella kenyensis]
MSDKKKFIIGLIFGISGVFIWNVYYDSYEKMYTVGEITGTSTGMKSGTSVQFQFMHNGKRIEGSSWKGSYAAKVGNRFIVEFGKDNQTVSSILLYYPVPDSLKIDVPRKGWGEVPDEIKKYRLKRKEDFGFREFFLID